MIAQHTDGKERQLELATRFPRHSTIITFLECIIWDVTHSDHA